MIASLFFVSVCVSDSCNFCNCHSDFPDFVDLKIQYFDKIICDIIQFFCKNIYSFI
nr:MAG TPA: hypothetical protein [Caudoviricetes sp.]